MSIGVEIIKHRWRPRRAPPVDGPGGGSQDRFPRNQVAGTGSALLIITGHQRLNAGPRGGLPLGRHRNRHQRARIDRIVAFLPYRPSCHAISYAS